MSEEKSKALSKRTMTVHGVGKAKDLGRSIARLARELHTSKTTSIYGRKGGADETVVGRKMRADNITPYSK